VKETLTKTKESIMNSTTHRKVVQEKNKRIAELEEFNQELQDKLEQHERVSEGLARIFIMAEETGSISHEMLTNLYHDAIEALGNEVIDEIRAAEGEYILIMDKSKEKGVFGEKQVFKVFNTSTNHIVEECLWTDDFEDNDGYMLVYEKYRHIREKSKVQGLDWKEFWDSLYVKKIS
jgi:predicted RNase H-like nuclease (RuvC/YqgF family)